MHFPFIAHNPPPESPGRLRGEPLYCLSWLFLAAELGLVCAALAVNPYLQLDSDMSSELVLANMLAKEGGILTTRWYYSTELRVLNTQLVFSLLFRIWNNWRFVRVGGTVALLVLLLLCCRYFCCQVGLKRCFPAIGGILLVPYLWMGHFVLSYGSYYVPHISITFAAVGLAFHCAKARKGWRRAALLALQLGLAFAAGLGGLRQLLICYLPAVMAAGGLALYEHFSPREKPQVSTPMAVPAAFGASLAAAFAGYLVNQNYLSRSHSFQSFGNISFSFLSFARLEEYFNDCLENFGYRSGSIFSVTLAYNICFGVIALLLFFCLRALWRHLAQYPPEQRFLFFFCALAFVLNTGVALFSDMLYANRYISPIAILFIPPVFAVLARYSKKSTPLRALCVALPAVLLALSVQYLQPFFNTPSGSTAREIITGFLLDNGYSNGYTLDFWNGNVFTELSDGQIDMWVLLVPRIASDNLNATYSWLQRLDHDTANPTGKVFVIFSDAEAAYRDSAPYLGDENIVYTLYPYIIYGYDSYDALVAQLQKPLPQA